MSVLAGNSSPILPILLTPCTAAEVLCPSSRENGPEYYPSSAQDRSKRIGGYLLALRDGPRLPAGLLRGKFQSFLRSFGRNTSRGRQADRELRSRPHLATDLNSSPMAFNDSFGGR